MTQPTATPWLSPNVVTQKLCPKVLPAIDVRLFYTGAGARPAFAPPYLGGRRSEPPRNIVEVDLRERKADESAAVRLGKASPLQLLHHVVELLEIARVHRDADHLVVGRLLRAAGN